MNQEEQAKKIQKVIAKAWADEVFKQKLISQPKETLREEGLDPPAELEVRVVESTQKVIYLVLPPKPPSDDIEVEEVGARLAASPGCACYHTFH